MGVANIDVEVNLVVSAEDAIKFLQATLRDLGVPQSTKIVRHKPNAVNTRFGSE